MKLIVYELMGGDEKVLIIINIHPIVYIGPAESRIRLNDGHIFDSFDSYVLIEIL